MPHYVETVISGRQKWIQLLQVHQQQSFYIHLETTLNVQHDRREKIKSKKKKKENDALQIGMYSSLK